MNSLIVDDIAKLKVTIDTQIQALAALQKEKVELEKQINVQKEKEEREKQLKIQQEKDEQLKATTREGCATKSSARKGKSCIIVSVIFLITLVERT